MKDRLILAIVLALVAFPAIAWAAPYFSESLADTINDAELEYFQLTNPSCQPFSLSGHTVSDLSGRSFVFTGGSVIEPTGTVRAFRPQSKIILNNDAETLYFRDPFGFLLDAFAFVSKGKGVVSVRNDAPDVPACLPDTPSTDSGSIGLPESGSGASIELPSMAESPISVDGPVVEEAPVDSVEESSDVVDVLPDVAADPSATPDPDSLPDSSAEVPNDSPHESVLSPEEEALSPQSPFSDEGGGGEISDSSGNVPEPSFSGALVADTETLSGSSESASGGEFPPPALSSSRATPEYLRMIDLNGDHRFETLEVSYSEAITGVVNTGSISLASATGGIFGISVASSTGFVRDFSVSGSILTLTLNGPLVLQSSRFRIDSSTSSHFRIKSPTVGFGLRTVSSGLEVVPFGLTTSFDGYSKDRISVSPDYFPILPPPPQIVTVYGSSNPPAPESVSTPPSSSGAVKPRSSSTAARPVSKPATPSKTVKKSSSQGSAS